MIPEPTRPQSTSGRIGVCTYCGHIEYMTRDHKNPKRLRPRGWRKYHMPSVDACSNCNQRKADQTYEEWMGWLLGDAGYDYLRQRLYPWVVPGCTTLDGRTPGQSGEPVWAGERMLHHCAARKACGILRMQLVVLGDGMSVWELLGRTARERAHQADNQEQERYQSATRPVLSHRPYTTSAVVEWDSVQIALVDSGKLALVVERRSHPRRRQTDHRDDLDAKVARALNAVLDGPTAEVKPYEGQ